MGATALESFTNDFETSLTAAVTSNSQATISVSSAANAPTSGNFRIRVNSEIMLVTGGHGTTTWTVKRGQENTTAATNHASGSIVTHVLTATGLVNSQLQSQEWTHPGSLHYTGASAVTTNLANPNTPTNYYSTASVNVAQQFTVTGTAIDRIVLYLKSQTTTTSADVTVSLQTNASSNPSGTLVGGTYAFTLPGEFFTQTVRAVSIPIRATVTAGATYWVVVSLQSTDPTNYLNVGYTTKGASQLSARTKTSAGAWTDTSTTTLSFDVYAGNTGLLVNTTEDDALAPWDPTLTKGVNWSELVFDATGVLTNVYEYLGTFRNTRTLSYDSTGVLTGVA